MKAVNLIPSDSKRSSGGRAAVGPPRGPAIALIGVLVIVLAFATIYVLTSNTVKDREAELATVQSQVTVAQAEAAKLTNYASFVKLASSRLATVSQIATQRFNWHAALSGLSKVVPPDTSLQSLLGTVSPSVGISGGGTSAVGTGTLRSTITAPAFELKGCTRTQDDVARLMSNLRLINGVTRVTLADSTKQDAAGQAGAGVTASSSGASGGCPANGPSFDLVVFFQPLPGQSSTTTTPGTSTSTSTTSTTTTSTTASATASAPATPSTSTASTVSTTTPASSGVAPVSSASGGSK